MHVEFLGYDDGEVADTRDLRRDITRQIRRWRPDLVIAQNPHLRRYGDLAEPVTSLDLDRLSSRALLAGSPRRSLDRLDSLDQSISHRVSSLWKSLADLENSLPTDCVLQPMRTWAPI